MVEKTWKYKTGIDQIDSAFKRGEQGGLNSDELIEIVGPSAGGKTTLCLKIAIKALIDQDEDTEIIYVDSTNYVNYDNVTYLLK